MYYWIVKRDGYEARDIMSYREELNAFRSHHIIVESLSPLLSDASFALGHQIKTEGTWRDLNDALVTYLQSQRVQDDKEQPVLGVNLGTNNPLRVGTHSNLDILSTGTIAAFKNPAAKI